MQMTIAVEGLRFYAYHGLYAEEKKNGQEFILDIYLQCPREKWPEDDIRDTINYERLAAIAQDEMMQRSDLIEHVAARIFTKIEAQSWPLTELRVRLRKPQPPFAQKADQVYVELEKNYSA